MSDLNVHNCAVVIVTTCITTSCFSLYRIAAALENIYDVLKILRTGIIAMRDGDRSTSSIPGYVTPDAGRAYSEHLGKKLQQP